MTSFSTFLIALIRIRFTPCNIYSMFVASVSIRSGKECEVYSDAFSKVIHLVLNYLKPLCEHERLLGEG